MAGTSWLRRVAGAAFRPFPRAKHFIVHRVLAPLHHWRYGNPALGRGHSPASNPDVELRLLKIEGAQHLARVSRPYGSAILPADGAQRPLVLMDMRITQISMRERGIPRYATALALALPEHMPGADIAYLVDPAQPMPDAMEGLQARGRVVCGTAEIGSLGQVSHFLQSCIFELHKDADELFPAELGRSRPHTSAIVYDVIPWLFPQQYLVDPYLARRYAYQLSLLSSVNHLFAISECAREDVARVANLPLSSVTNVYGGIDESRWSEPAPASTSSDVLRICNEQGESFVLRQPYWLYVGGGDFRKNVNGLVRAFARLLAGLPPGADRPALVIACNLHTDQRKEASTLAASLGAQPGADIIITGFVSDATLATCYRNAFATVFPSLYEGLGLPVLESYHFGVPALASGVSSLTEVTAPSCQFDPSSEESIAAAMLRMHNEPALRAESLAFGREIMAQCNWGQAAQKLAKQLLA
jgi:glycosyltransferase involved in cell wall biosynthesis